MNMWKIGVRSIGRNPRRTIVTTAAMAFGGAVMIFYVALLAGFKDTMERNALLMELGELQVHAEGYRRDPDLYKRIPQPRALIGKLEALGLKAAPRLYGTGLVAAGASSAGVQIRGISVKQEMGVTGLHTHIQLGEWLNPAHPSGAVLGKKLARTLNIKLGDEVVIVSQAADGSMANELFKVRGVLEAVGDSLDRAGFFVTENAFRELLVVPQGTHEIAAVRVDRNAHLVEITAGASAIAVGLETKSWRELNPMIAQMMDTSLVIQAFMLFITYLAVAMVVLNATLMGVFERIREFGVLKALGVSPFGIAQVVFFEVITQGLLAMVAAVAAGWGISKYFEVYGLDLSSMTSGASLMGVAFDPVWYTRITPMGVVLPAVSLLVVALLAAIYPGAKAAVIAPAEAMHHI